MVMVKTSITLPQKDLDAVDRVAARRGISRSALFTSMSRLLAAKDSDEELRKKIHAFYEDPEVCKDASEMAKRFARTIPREEGW